MLIHHRAISTTVQRGSFTKEQYTPQCREVHSSWHSNRHGNRHHSAEKLIHHGATIHRAKDTTVQRSSFIMAQQYTEQKTPQCREAHSSWHNNRQSKRHQNIRVAGNTGVHNIISCSLRVSTTYELYLWVGSALTIARAVIP